MTVHVTNRIDDKEDVLCFHSIKIVSNEVKRNVINIAHELEDYLTKNDGSVQFSYISVDEKNGTLFFKADPFIVQRFFNEYDKTYIHIYYSLFNRLHNAANKLLDVKVLNWHVDKVRAHA